MPETILIVDDERAIAQLTALWVKQAGYSPLTAFDGRSGIAAATTHRPNLILLDIRMPDLDGFEVHRQLKLSPEVADVPVIFLSAHAQEATRQEAIARGASFFLPKPYDSKEMLAAVRAALADKTGSSVESVDGEEMKRPRILIADDDRAILNLLQTRFCAMGYDVTTATNGPDAISLACDEAPSLMILDINMPGTGFMVHRCKRQIGSLRLKPVIYVTGASGGPVDLAKKMGAYAVLQKPIDFWKLAETVQTAIQMDGDPDALLAARGKCTD